MFRHENVSQDSKFQFPPQLTESRNPLLLETLGVKQARDPALRDAAGQIMQRIEAAKVL